MRAAGKSPFEGVNARQIDEQWIVWQKKSERDISADRMRTGHQTDMLPDLQLPSMVQQEEPPQIHTQPPIERTIIRHQRYDAVVRRMQNAVNQTGAYSAWS